MALGDGVATSTTRVLSRYERLMSLTVRHDFYGDGATCADFAIVPTAATQTLLQNLQLIAKPRPTGIDILYCTAHGPAMLRHLWGHRDRRRAEEDPHAGLGAWTRLAFTFTLRNPLFTNFTEIPLGVRPGKHCLYVSNQTATTSDGQVSLAADPSKFSKMQEIIFSPAHLRIEAPGAKRVVVHNTSGRVIMIAEPPAAAGSPPNMAGSKQTIPIVPLGHDGSVELDMTNQPPGIYSYTAAAAGGGDRRTEFLYAGTSNTPLVMLDLFLASPNEDPGGHDNYPVRLPDRLPPSLASAKNLLDPEPQQAAQEFITTRDYQLHFKARKTIWTYFVVLPQNSPAAQGLAIEAMSSDGFAFEGPHSATVAGAPAYGFAATTSRALQSRPNVSLRLRGAAMPGNGSTRTLLDRLPLPSAEFIKPPRDPAKDPTPTSEVYVYL